MDEVKSLVEAKVARGFMLLDEDAHKIGAFQSSVEAAAGEFREVLNLSPDCPEALLGLGRCLCSIYSLNFEAPAASEAIACLLKAEALRPDDPETHYWLGSIYTYVAQWDKTGAVKSPYKEAIANYLKAIELGHKDKGKIFEFIGAACFKQKRYDEALRYFALSHENRAASPCALCAAYSLSADIYEKRGDLPQALEWCERFRQFGYVLDADALDKRIQRLQRKLSKV